MTQQDKSGSTFQSQFGGAIPPPPHDPRYIVGEMLRRDQERTRILAILAVFFWLIGAAGMLLMVYGLNRLVIFIRVSDMANSGLNRSTTEPFRLTESQIRMLDGTTLIHHSMPYIGASIVALMIAALLTVLLIFSSRRATLSRINISLIQISEELRQMRQNPGQERNKT